MAHDLEWVRDSVFYQIFPDRFARSHAVPKPSRLEPWEDPPTLHGFKGGDLMGVAEHLDHIVEVGATAIYLNPVFASTANHRYHTHDYFHVDPILGGDAALAALIKAAHRRGIRIVLDGVFNHASRGFFQFNHTLENGRNSPYVDWFHFNRRWLEAGRPIAAYSLEDGRQYHPPASETSLERHGYSAWWDIPALPKFNTDHPEVRAFLFSVAEHWIRFGIDGWRLDVPSEINDDGFWQEFRRRVKSLRSDAYIVGEIWHDASRWLKGDQFDGVTNYLLGKALLGFFAGDALNREAISSCGLKDAQSLSAEAFAVAIDEITHLYPREAVECQLNILGSHDTPRLLTMVSGQRERVKLLMSGLFTLPGAPCLYYGDEIGMAGGHDPDCRRGFEWDQQLWDQELLRHIQKLAQLRRQSKALRRGDTKILFARDHAVVYARKIPEETVFVAHNATGREQAIDLAEARFDARGPESLLSGHVSAEGLLHIPAFSTGIWVR